MAFIIPALMIAGTALSAYGAVQQANAQKAAHDMNAAMSERDASVALQQAEAEAVRINRDSQRVQGAMRAGFGASGLTVEGSALDALGDSAAQAQLDIETVKYKGNLKAMGYHDTARLDRMAGDTAMEQGYLKSASEVLTGVGRTSVSYASGARKFPGSNMYGY